MVQPDARAKAVTDDTRTSMTTDRPYDNLRYRLCKVGNMHDEIARRASPPAAKSYVLQNPRVELLECDRLDEESVDRLSDDDIVVVASSRTSV